MKGTKDTKGVSRTYGEEEERALQGGAEERWQDSAQPKEVQVQDQEEVSTLVPVRRGLIQPSPAKLRGDTRAMELFEMPPSPFEREHMRLGTGFLGGPQGLLFLEEVDRPPKRRASLTSTQRHIIASSTSDEVSPADLSEHFGVALSYVYELRNTYQRRQNKRTQLHQEHMS